MKSQAEPVHPLSEQRAFLVQELLAFAGAAALLPPRTEHQGASSGPI